MLDTSESNRAEDLSTPNGRSDARSEDGLAAILESARCELEHWSSALLQLGRIQVERVRLAALDGVIGASLALAVVLTAATALVAGTLLVVRGAANGIAAATGREWLGELAGGLVVLGGLAVAWACLLRKIRRTELERARRRLTPEDTESAGTAGGSPTKQEAST